MELNTSYFPLHVVEDATCGYCHEFAAALHHLTGMNMAGLWRKDREGVSVLIHAFCITTNGYAVDVEGGHLLNNLLENLKGQFTSGNFLVEEYASTAEYIEAVNKCKSKLLVNFMLPRKEGVLCAGASIRNSPAFLTLLSELGVSVEAPERSEREVRSIL